MMNCEFNFELHVKTSAKGKTGIHWRNIKSQEDQFLEDTPGLISSEVWRTEKGQRFIVNDLIDECTPSLVIFRKDGKLLLEVSGIESLSRSQELGRKVFNLMVWIFDDVPEYEKMVRMIAYCAIQNFLGKDSTFSEMIENSIKFHQLEEFKVDISIVTEFMDSLKTKYQQQFTDRENPNNTYQIKSQSNDDLDNLAKDFKNYRLPQIWESWNSNNKGVLVVVTDYLIQKTILHDVGVWRGFAINVQEPEKPVIPELQKKTELPTMEISQLPTPKKSKNRLMIVLFMILLILVIAIALILINIQPQIQKTTQPQIQQTLNPQSQPNFPK